MYVIIIQLDYAYIITKKCDECLNNYKRGASVIETPCFRHKRLRSPLVLRIVRTVTATAIAHGLWLHFCLNDPNNANGD